MGAINPSDRRAFQREQDALQIRLSARFERRLKAEIFATMVETAKAYPKRGEVYIPVAIADHSQEMAKILSDDYLAVASIFGRQVLDEAKSQFGPSVVKNALNDALRLAIQGFIFDHIAKKITQINRTTEDQIRSIIRSGAAEGLGVTRIAQNIVDLAPRVSSLRAHVIARTETHTAANFGAQASAKLTGLDMRREWVSAMDDRTRDTDEADHVAADGQIVGMDEPFLVSGEELMFPGDPIGSPANVIMCRCQVAFIAD